jgi:hypothetical protein
MVREDISETLEERNGKSDNIADFLQNHIVSVISNFPGPEPVHDLYTRMSLRFSHVYDYAKMMQAASRNLHENTNFHNIGQGEAQHRKCEEPQHGTVQACGRSNYEPAFIALIIFHSIQFLLIFV